MVHPIVKLAYTLVGFAILYYLFPYLIPFIAALVLAVLFEPVVLKLQKWLKISRAAAVTVNFTAFLLITGTLGFLGSIKIINQVTALVQQLPQFAADVGRGIEELIQKAHILFEDLPAETVRGMENAIRDTVGMGDKISNGAAAILGTAMAIPNIFIILVVTLVSFYLSSLQLPELKVGFLKLFSERAKDKINIILTDINRAIVGFVRAQLIISLLTYLFILTGLAIIGIKFALTIALLIVLVDILPILGTGIVMLPWAAFLFIIDDRFTAVGILILYVLIIVFRRIIEPKILGDNIGLSPLTTVISMYVGFRVLGIGGVFLAPVLCIIFKAMRKAGLFKQEIDF